ncbi:Nramp family divalent metal transporter [Streptomyces sp. NPDC054796]
MTHAEHTPAPGGDGSDGAGGPGSPADARTAPAAPAPFPLSTRHLPAPEVRELPEPPAKMWRIIGPGVVAAGVGLSSGEFILWPYIASQAGLFFLWGAVVGVVTQWFLNMEVERYTLATGETAMTGFNRMWRHWGAVLATLTYASNLWPGWATSSATMLSYVFGGEPTVIAIGLLLLIGAILTLAPVVYTALERMLFLKVAVIGVFFLLAVIFAVEAASWRELPKAVTHVGQFPTELGIAVLMGAIAYAGAGGGQNLCQSNWIRDKGFGMGHYVPRLVSPVTGKEEDATRSAAGYVFVPTGENLARWKRWWRFANTEQALTFGLVTVVTIVLASLLAHSTLFGTPGLSNDVGFVEEEGQVLQAQVGGWFGVFFWLIGAFSLFSAATGIVDYTSRLAADVLKSTYLRRSRHSESRLYFCLVWGLVAIGVTVLLLGLDQPLVLLVISACVAGLMMFVYSALLLVMNRRALPAPLKVRGYRAAALVWGIVLFGALSVLTVRQQFLDLFG